MLDVAGPALPRVVHWGADLGEADDAALAALAVASVPPLANTLDEPVPVAVVPEAATGWMGRPGLAGHREGRDWSPLVEVREVDVVPAEAGGRVVVRASDDVARLALTVELELTPQGLVRTRAAVTSTAAADAAPFVVDDLLVALPVPSEATELHDLAGRWSRERTPQRRPLTVGAHVRDSRRGRTGPDAATVLVAGAEGFGFRHGQVWGVHVAFSGNHRTYAERTNLGEQVLGGGELLLPGEVRLGAGETYAGPWVYASYGVGMDAMADRFHRWLRDRPHHPRSPRPVVMNTWEAVYFDHDLARLTELADLGAAVGVERYVLDDGWFRGRRSDDAGLGDWTVDEAVWPQGLHPLVDHVRGLGMEFGLWFEPEMVNPDSDLAREHPEWILQTGDRLPPEQRRQQVLDLTHPGAYAHVRDQVLALVREYRLDYLKWDHNRDLVDAGTTRTGGAGVHGQTLALYRLLDEIRAAAPGLEIESCSSGGARVDLEVLEHTDRVWASDCIDAHERQMIQRWTAQLLPPELVGSHVGAARSHTTGRVHGLGYRAGTALFGHFGVEWDVSRATSEERAELAAWVATYKEHRGLLLRGTVVRGDHPDPALWVHGAVADDGAEALFALVAVERSDAWPPGRVRLPGLDPDRTYRVAPAGPGADLAGLSSLPAWWADGVVLPGRVLGEVGVQAPPLLPDTLALLHAVAV
ncbi:alpha-galactosidase [Actinotalea ferrariae]|nr:alpha-galactosidase [Actinotalea ferrariae]